jgi:hypothetical protein
VRTGGLKSGPFAAAAIYYYRSTFTVKCFLEIHRWFSWLAAKQAGGQANFTFDSAFKIQRIQRRFWQTRNPTKL